jgi:hypothetical protein
LARNGKCAQGCRRLHRWARKDAAGKGIVPCPGKQGAGF